MAYLLNTNILVAAIKAHPRVLPCLRSLAPADLLLSSVVLGELETGVNRSAWPERNRLQLHTLVEDLELVPVDRPVAMAYGRIRESLERQGMPIAPMICGSLSRRKA